MNHLKNIEMSSTVAQQPALGKSNRSNRRSGSNNLNPSQKKFNKYHDRSLRKRSKSFSACLPKIKNMHTKPVLPTKFLLGGNINDPLNLNSLQDEEINRAQNAVTPKSSPIPTPPNRRGPVQLIIPHNIHDPLNLMSCTTNIDDDDESSRPIGYDPPLCSPLKLGGAVGLGGYRLGGGGGGRKKRVRKRRTTSGCSGNGAGNMGGNGGEGEAVVPEREGDSAMVPVVQVDAEDVLKEAVQKGKIEDSIEVLSSTPSTTVIESTVNIPSTTIIQTTVQSQEATSAPSTTTSTASNTELSSNVSIPPSSTSQMTKKEQRNKRKSSDDKELGGNNKKSRFNDQQGKDNNKKNLDLSLNIPSSSQSQANAKKELNQSNKKDSNQQNKKDQRNKRKSSDGEHSGGVLKEHLGKKFKFAPMDKIVSPVVPQPGAWLKRTNSRTNWQQQRTQMQRSLNKGENLVMPKFRVKDKQYQYGNYNRYYGYRNPQNELDPRLKCFSYYRELFEGKDILDIGCNIGHITLSVARDFGARSVVGIDIDKNLIGIARKNVKHYVSSSNDSPPRNEQEEEESGNRNAVDESSCSGKGARNIADNKIGKKEHTSEFYPISMPILYGPIDVPGFMVEKNKGKGGFPHNVTFVQGNYVLENDALIATEQPQFDIILCLSITKWIHLNWGDSGIKQAFRRMYAQLRPGGKLILEPQHWASYKNKKKLTEAIYKNYNSIKLFPEKFTQYLLSSEIGFAKSEILGFPMSQHQSRGFQRPIQVYTKSTMFPSERVECSSSSCHDNSNSCSSRVYVPLPATPDLLLDPSLPITSHSHVYAPNTCTSSTTLLTEPEPTCPYFLSPQTPTNQSDLSTTLTPENTPRGQIVYCVRSSSSAEVSDNRAELVGDEVKDDSETTVRSVHLNGVNGVDYDGEDSMDDCQQNGRRMDQTDGDNEELHLEKKRDNT